MSIVVNKRPYDRNWSGNPIHYTLYSSDAEADTTMWFEYKVFFRRSDQPDFIDIITLVHKPVSGSAKIDIQDILDGLMEHELPYPASANEYTSPYISQKATGLFYITFREVTPEVGDNEFDESEEATPLFVIKGGINFTKWRGDNYWVNYYDPLKSFLTWQQKNSLHSLTERMYLAWLNLTTIYEGDIKMKRTVKFTDGSEDVAYLNCPVSKYYIIIFPSGGKQLEIQDIDNTKTIYWWELQIYHMNPNPEEPMSEAFRYYADNRQEYNAITLNYRNSLGGIDSLRIRGVIDYTNDREFTQTERIVLHDYFSNYFIKGRIGADNSSEIQVYKGDAGFLAKEEQDRIRDIHFKREVWWEQQNKWLPVMITTPSNRLRLSTDKVFAFPVEFSIASGPEFYYTPQSINLAEPAEPIGLICSAVIGSPSSNYVPGTGWVISWSLVSGTPVKYQVSTPGVSAGAPGETITTSYTFVWLPVGSNIITIRPVCLIGGIFYLGAAITLEVVVEAVCVGVGISSAPVYLPDAIVDTPYSYIMNLTGTAPFNIDNITKPAWMSINVVGSTIEFTGTPAPGDLGSGITVSFDIHNCSGGYTVAYSDTIDVLASSDYGAFTIENLGAGSNFVKNVFPNNPSFYTFTSGGLPVLAGQTATGFMISAISTPVSVSLILASSLYYIELYKNGLLQQTIYTPGSGIYSFNAVSYLITDSMTIKLKSD